MCTKLFYAFTAGPCEICLTQGHSKRDIESACTSRRFRLSHIQLSRYYASEMKDAPWFKLCGRRGGMPCIDAAFVEDVDARGHAGRRVGKIVKVGGLMPCPWAVERTYAWDDKEDGKHWKGKGIWESWVGEKNGEMAADGSKL